MLEKKFRRKRHAKTPGDRFRNKDRVNGIQPILVKALRRIEGVRLYPKLFRKRSDDDRAKDGFIPGCVRHIQGSMLSESFNPYGKAL